MNADRSLPGDWYPGQVPHNAIIDAEAYLETTYSFQLFRSQLPEALRIGRGASVYLGVMFDLGAQARVAIGDFTLMNGSRLICNSEISIGAYCLISWNTVLMDTWRLPFDRDERRRELEKIPLRQPRHAQAETAGHPIRIADKVWIGFDSCVLPGVTIGEGSVVGARSVVDKDVAPFTVVAGNPARFIRRLDSNSVPPGVSALAKIDPSTPPC